MFKTTKYKDEKGFTLIEIMIVVVVIAILASIALPAYQDYVLKSKRAEAKAALSLTAQRMERCFTSYNAYNDAKCDTSSVLSDSGNWQVAITASATSYLLSAGTTAQHTDVTCDPMTLSNTGETKAANTLNKSECW